VDGIGNLVVQLQFAKRASAANVQSNKLCATIGLGLHLKNSGNFTVLIS